MTISEIADRIRKEVESLAKPGEKWAVSGGTRISVSLFNPKKQDSGPWCRESMHQIVTKWALSWNLSGPTGKLRPAKMRSTKRLSQKNAGPEA